MKSQLQSLPRRVDSLVASKGPYFAEVEDELRDIKRVNAQGQEEDLRLALSRMITRVEELTSMLKEAFKAQTDIQTELTLAKSNLQLALANNEMLEDALKRTGHVKDVGWRRWSAREQQQRDAEEERRRSVDSGGSCDTAHNSPAQPHPSPMPPSPLPSASAVVSPVPSSDGRFFKFRFGSSSSSNSANASSFPSSPRLASGSKSPLPNGAHLTSASLPSLVPARDWEKEVEDLNGQLKREREARQNVVAQKAALEAELESLSQALFEEANKMVSTERKKLAETEDELKELQAEREALRNALRLVERQGRDGARYAAGHAHAPSTSSARAVKSLPSTRPSSPAFDEDPTSAGTVVAVQPRRPPPLVLDPESPPLSASPVPDETLQRPPELDSSHSRGRIAEAASRSSSVRPSPLPSPSPSIGAIRASPSPSPSVSSPEVGEYVYPLMRPVDFLQGEVSPWADAPSYGSPKPVA
ncbi:hypothetical protein IEO21_05301 [Rhodonia placenta]|uniref:GDP/GTP exchange factor Sec2 N-terminal domain-containing protein n=1 Tax=Rhodonia placenta TaxID=104341 RepID=A0A8H7U1N8_9APHY|nr:hypothetical protein IEO21_05301 [Postia placenta]